MTRLAAVAHHAHVAAIRPRQDDPIESTPTPLPDGVNQKLGVVLGLLVSLVTAYALFQLVRAVVDAIGSYKDGSAVPFASIIVILVCLALVAGGISSVVFLVA